MINILSRLISGKRVLLLGFGKEGQSTYRLIKEVGLFAELGIADVNHPADISNTNLPMDISDIKVHSGEGYLDHVDEYDVAFKSPGIVLPKHYSEYSCKVTSQTEVFLQSFNRQVVGITGTKGKSTVASLLYHVLHDHHLPCLLAGNIGTPVFDICKDVNPETVIILELSSHQLEICGYSPTLSVFLNIYEDHLDHYGTMEDYIRAKKNIYVHQHPLDTLYCDKGVMPPRNESISRMVVVDKEILPFKSFDDIDGVKIRGTHNLVNCAFAYGVAKSFGISDEGFIESLRSYAPLPHRLELIGNKNGVDYYDDSISTTVESAINAIESIPNASTIILGGMDRGIDYEVLANYLIKSKLSNVICMYQSGRRIYELLMKCEDVNFTLYYCDDLPEATEMAKNIAKPGTACILSPASASYGDFRNFEERGDMFRTLIF